MWGSLVGKPCGKASRESHRSLDPREGKHDTAATAREKSTRACPHSRRGLTPMGRLQKYPKIHVGTGEESSGSGTDSTQCLRPRLRWKRNPEWPPSNSRVMPPFPESPRCLSPFQGNLFSLHCLDFQAEVNSHYGGTGDSLVGKPRGKATDPLIHAKGSMTLLLQLGRKAHVQAPTRDED